MLPPFSLAPLTVVFKQELTQANLDIWDECGNLALPEELARHFWKEMKAPERLLLLAGLVLVLFPKMREVLSFLFQEATPHPNPKHSGTTYPREPPEFSPRHRRVWPPFWRECFVFGSHT